MLPCSLGGCLSPVTTFSSVTETSTSGDLRCLLHIYPEKMGIPML